MYECAHEDRGPQLPGRTVQSRSSRLGQGSLRVAAAPASAGLLQLIQRSAGNRAAQRYLGLQRCGDTPPEQCSCHDDQADERESHDETSAVDTAPVQRLEDESLPIGEAAADQVVPGEPSDQAQDLGTGNITLQRHRGEGPLQRQEVVVQRMTRAEEITLSRTSPGRAVLDPNSRSISLFNYGIDRPEPKPFHVALLAELSQFLREEAALASRIRVAGHADPTGDAPHNATLSAERASGVAAVVQAQGSAAETIAEGDTHPVASNSTVEGRSRNRRVDIHLSARPSPVPPRPRRPGEPTRNFCDTYPLLCGITPPILPIPIPWPLLCFLVPEICAAVPCMVDPALCVPEPPQPPGPPDRPDEPDRSGPTVVFGPVRAANTPAAMQDRIPDSGATPVLASLSGLDASRGPVTIRTDGAGTVHGEVQVNGSSTAMIAGSTVLSVAGAIQTSERSGGFHLALEAVLGGSVIGRSAPFAVRAIMSDMHTSTGGVISDDTGVMLEALMTKQSDGRDGIRSLEWMEYGEHLTLVNEDGGMAGAGLGQHGFLAMAHIDQVDRHGMEMAHMLRPGSQVLHQTHSMTDYRTGATEIPVANSGFAVVRRVGPDPDRPGCLVFTIVKSGQGATAGNVTSAAGTGVASARVPLPCSSGPDGGGPVPGTETLPIPHLGPMPRGTTPIFYQGGVPVDAAVGDLVMLRFSFRVDGDLFFSTIPCTVVSRAGAVIRLETLNPVPVNVAPAGKPPIVVGAQRQFAVPKVLL